MTRDGRHLTLTVAVGWLLAAIAGAIHAWAERHIINVDGISYLEIAQAYRRGDWHAAINAYWSPLFSWVLDAVFAVVRPAPSSEIEAAHAATFVIYLIALAAFSFLLREMIRTARNDDEGRHDLGIRLPDWAWLGIGYALFLWSSLWFIGLGITPDLLVSAIVYAVAALLLRIRREPDRLFLMVALGGVAGLGYLAKAAMFPMAFVFLAVAPAVNLRAKVVRTIAALLAFAIVSGPFIAALSTSKGFLTVGQAGKLNYAWFVNGVPQTHWRGEPAGSGVPTHAERQVLDAPAIYEFGTPIAGSRPNWYDPSYWSDGVSVHFDLRQQLRILVSHARMYLDFLVFEDLGSFAVCAALLLVLGRAPKSTVSELLRQRTLWLPALAAFGLYALVLVERRYVGAYVLLFWMGMFAAVRLPDSTESRRLAGAVTIVLLTVTGIRMSLLTTQLIVNQRMWTADNRSAVVDGLRRLQISENDPVACIGRACLGHDWARVARVRIVAELPGDPRGGITADEQLFWGADVDRRERILRVFEQTGARALLATPPANAPLDGWIRVGTTDQYLYSFSGDDGRELSDARRP